jgi:tricorn protease
MKRALNLTVLFAIILAASAVWGQAQQEPLLLQDPTLNRTQIVFAYAGDLWIVPRSGGEATRLTAGPGLKTNPKFSPDGQWIAYSAETDGNEDVYVIPVAGGQPKQLTFNPAPDSVEGWTPDGKQVLFRSSRYAYAHQVMQLFTVPMTGGLPQQVPLPTGFAGSYSTDGKHIAYVPHPLPWGTWKYYRGGTLPEIWIANLADSSVEKMPHTVSIDFNPMWVGDKIYFLSNREGRDALFDYDLKTQKITNLVTNNSDFDFKSASAGPGAIVYEQFGSLHLYDLESGQEHVVHVSISGDFPDEQPHFEKVAEKILNAKISPTGQRAVFEAHGEILTVPAENGSIRNLTNTPGVADRDPAWSPDGQWIAYFSDESGNYELHLRGQTGLQAVKKIPLGDPPGFYYNPVWSPNNKKIAYVDNKLNLWFVDLDTGKNMKVDTNTYDPYVSPVQMLEPSWSPDSRWIAYTKQLASGMRAVFVYSLESGKSTQVTDGMSDAAFAVFDRSGKYLYFTASTDAGPTTGWLDMSSFGHPTTWSVYVMVLRSDLPSPLAPLSDDEKVDTTEPGGQDGPGEKNGRGAVEKQAIPPTEVKVDFENIGQRILALPIPAADYLSLQAGKAGEIYLEEGHQFQSVLEARSQPTPPFNVVKFDLKSRKTEPLISGISDFILSFNGEKFLYRQHQDHWAIALTGKPSKPGEGALNLDEMSVWVVPQEEWKQMYHEVWRIERDFLYDKNLQGLKLPATEEEYARFLPGIASRDDLDYLFNQMLAQINVSHMFVRRANVRGAARASDGLLGTDYTIDRDRYRFANVFAGENWNPELRAPLTQPGVNIKAGDYLLAVNGRELRGTDNIYSFFLNTAEKQVVLKVGPNPDGSGSRDVTVVPISSEADLRNRAWIEHNIQTVDRLSHGQLAYAYLPDTANGGYTNFNRYYLAQVSKHGTVIDERFNTGGAAADYIIEYMQRKPWNYWYSRHGNSFPSPFDAIYGPKAMIINQYSASGGDMMPWFFRHVGLGPLVGERTYGGLVAIYDYPTLIGGGSVTAPRLAFFNTDGQWDVENHGVPPDVEVELDPKVWRQGHDTQLERAVEIVMDELKKNPPKEPVVPQFPNYSNKP